jgi:chemotaxis protein CheD
MNRLVVGIADCKCTNQARAEIVTYALGSCIAVMVHDPLNGVGGLLHYMLPESSIDREKAKKNPFMFADTGVAALIENVEKLGGRKRGLTVWVAGGAQVLDGNGHFQIGKRNYLALRKLLWKHGLMIHAESVGGKISRTVRLELPLGRVHSREGGTEKELRALGRKTGGS